jgi:hypothetical protein
MKRSAFLSALLATALAGCLGSYSSSGGGKGSSGSGSSDPGAGGQSGSNGANGSGSGSMPATPPPPKQPPDPNGFQLTIAPLLDAQGCTECHHAGRPIDLTQYPFMAGDPATAAQKLIAALGTTMPPAPRDPPPASLATTITQWQGAGMKP